MPVFDGVKKILTHINSNVEQLAIVTIQIDILNFDLESVSKKMGYEIKREIDILSNECEGKIDALIMSLKMLEDKESLIREELDLLYTANINKYKRHLSIWITELDFYLKEILVIVEKPSDFSLGTLGYLKYRLLIHSELNTVRQKVTPNACYTFFAQLLNKIIKDLQQRCIDLKKNLIQLNTEVSEVNDKAKKDKDIQLKSIFNEKNNSFKVCISILEDLEIILDGESNMKPGRMGKLVGAIIAIKSTPGMLKADYTNPKLLDYFNTYLGTKYKTIAKRGRDYNEGLCDAKRYIKQNFKNK